MAREKYGKRRQQGVAMVEFAIVLPLLLLLLLGIAELGRLLFQYNSLLQASRDAGRFVAGKAWNRTLGKIDLTGDPQLVLKTQYVAVYGIPAEQPGSEVVPGLSTGDVTVSAVGEEHVEVSITYTFIPLFGSGIPALIGSEIRLDVPLVATTVMRAL